MPFLMISSLHHLWVLPKFKQSELYVLEDYPKDHGLKNLIAAIALELSAHKDSWIIATTTSKHRVLVTYLSRI